MSKNLLQYFGILFMRALSSTSCSCTFSVPWRDDVLQLGYRCFTIVLQVFYKSVTRVLQECVHKSVTGT